MNAPTTHPAAETEIRAILAEWESAVRARDLNRIVARYAPDLVAFDAILALQFKGAEAYTKHWEACLGMCSGPMIFEIHDLQVRASEELALAYGLVRCGGAGPDGKEMVGWTRMTIAFQKLEGKWLVVHEHFSAPFDVQTNQALWLQP